MTTRPTAVKATGGLCLLGAYADSDDDESDVSEKTAQSKEANGNQATDIDSTLANFLAEIDAITAPQPAAPVVASAPPPTPPRPEPKEAATPALSPTASNGSDTAQTPGWHYDTQCSLAGVEIEMGDWQEVWDENTGCYYYWNTQTNEVTWELPQYLATQVQGLQHYQPSSVTGTEAAFVVNTDMYTKERTTAASSSKSGPVITKREVKKEVNEGIQALSNSEEERKGVAAALLAPLLPEGVKEEEERWRRKVICKEADPVSETKETSTASEETGPSIKPPEVMMDGTEDPSQEELCSVVQSGESEEEEEEEEQDTLELELALERKKAELRALEEGDGSVSGSSPRSDISQPASQDGVRRIMSKRGKWKMFVRATSPESTSRSSSKTGRDSPENGETAIGAEDSEKIDEISDKETEVEESSEKIKVQLAPKVEEEQDLKFQIGELSNTLTSKFEFLGINRQSISNFHMLLLQTETRIADWREGALNGNYLGLAAAPALMSYAECSVPIGVTTPSLQPAQARGTMAAPAVVEPPPPPPPPPTPTPPPPPPAPKVPPPEKTRKGKKDKAKKSKTKMPSLVKKWQSIQRELDEEDNSSSSEEDRESTAQKRIEEWKQQQLVSGLAERNANFEALPEVLICADGHTHPRMLALQHRQEQQQAAGV